MTWLVSRAVGPFACFDASLACMPLYPVVLSPYDAQPLFHGYYSVFKCVYVQRTFEKEYPGIRSHDSIHMQIYDNLCRLTTLILTSISIKR